MFKLIIKGAPKIGSLSQSSAHRQAYYLVKGIQFTDKVVIHTMRQVNNFSGEPTGKLRNEQIIPVLLELL